VDASALVKLVRTERESEAAQRFLGAASTIVSSIVVVAELLLAARKAGDEAAFE
jgi:predicted nucleic acid-binding protein